MEHSTSSAHELKEEGLRLFQEGLYDEAAEKFEQAHELFIDQGEEIDAAEMINNLGVIHRMRGDWDQAIAALEDAREIFARLKDQNREAQTLGNLGGLYASKGEREQAIECLHLAAKKFAGLGDRQHQGETLLALGVQMWKTGDRSGGLATYEAGLHTMDEPTPGQKALRGLLDLRTKLLGRGK